MFLLHILQAVFVLNRWCQAMSMNGRFEQWHSADHQALAANTCFFVSCSGPERIRKALMVLCHEPARWGSKGSWRPLWSKMQSVCLSNTATYSDIQRHHISKALEEAAMISWGCRPVVSKLCKLPRSRKLKTGKRHCSQNGHFRAFAWWTPGCFNSS